MPDFIEQIKRRFTINDIVNLLHLERERNASGGYFIKSIYRDEKTPSMMIYENENRFVDFGNDEKGDQIQLYQDYYNLDTKTAIVDLMKLGGLDSNGNNNQGPTREPAVKQEPAESVIEKALKDCSQDEKYFYEECLGIIEENSSVKDSTSIKANEIKALERLKIKRINENTEVFDEMYYYCLTHCSNQHYKSYLSDKRGLSLSGIENSKLFFIDNYNQVNNHLKKTFKNDPDKLKHSGLFNENENLIFYNHRLIIPYQFKGKIVYLRGRYFDQDNNYKTNEYKYIGLKNDSLGVNTPKRFFNIDVLSRMIPGSNLYVTEGEFDCLLLEDLKFYSIGVPGAGNLPEFEKFMKLKDFKIIVVPDNDAAGNKLIDGKYTDKHGNEKYSDKNLVAYFEKLKKDLFIKRLPDNIKDVTEFLMGN